jgi:hypothetical protein
VRELVLEFAGDVRLTAVSIATAGGERKAVDPPPETIGAKFMVAVRDELSPGEYVVTWRAVGGDTHVVSGEFRFTISGADSG